MGNSTLQDTIQAAMKAAMKARDKPRLSTIRLMRSEIKRIEVDERAELDDARILAVLDKMVKQRRDSARQYDEGGRSDLAEQERAEIGVIREFLPQPLDEAEISAVIEEILSATGAADMRAMGQVMGQLKPRLQGRADLGQVSQQVKQRLAERSAASR